MAAMIQITASLAFDEDEVSYTAIRASGPGGQNVNKVSSAIQLRFDARRSPSLPDEVATRAIRLAGSRATKDGVIIITAERFRDQPRNREDALARLVMLLQRAAERPKPRKATRPTAASREKRLTGKAKRGAVKAKRGRVAEE
jgi:ribosome-associated protein